jgi:hypothetical protein
MPDEIVEDLLFGFRYMRLVRNFDRLIGAEDFDLYGAVRGEGFSCQGLYE